MCNERLDEILEGIEAVANVQAEIESARGRLPQTHIGRLTNGATTGGLVSAVRQLAAAGRTENTAGGGDP